MKKNLLISLKLSFMLLMLCAVFFPLLVALIGKTAPGHGKGNKIMLNGKMVGYENVGQKFTADKYFQGRPSAADYNAAGSGGSNKGPSNPAYLKTVEARIDSFMVHNPGVAKHEIPADLVTASGSGLDPHISPAAAYIQVKRVAAIRKLEVSKLTTLVEAHIEKTILGPSVVNVLKLNISLDTLK